MQKHTRIPGNIEQTKELVYRYLYANGLYPVDEEYTAFESYARGSGFKDPRRWQLKVTLKYHALENETGLDITFDFRSSFVLMNFSAHDKQYYRGFIEHFIQAIREDDISVYHSQEKAPSHFSLTQWIYYLYYTFLLAAIVFVPTLDFLWKGKGMFVLIGLGLLLFTFILFKHLRFRQKTLRL